jgi:hypothetical protein
MRERQTVQDVDDTGGVDGPIRLDGEGFAVADSSITLSILRVRPLAVVSN